MLPSKTCQLPLRTAPYRGGCRWIALWAFLCTGVVGQAAERPTAVKQVRPRVVDPAVVPAGGVHCTSCGPAGCRHGHHPGCREGACVPYCPVRPQQYGYYGTRWRKWPGQDVVQTSGEQAPSPANPPRSEVPGADEESMSREPAAGQAEAEPAPAQPERAPARPQPSRPAPAPEPEPQPPAPRDEDMPDPVPPPADEPAVPTEPRPEPPAEPKSEPEPPADPQPEPPVEPESEPNPEPKSPPKVEPPRGEDENLFEVLSGSGWRAKRKFAVGPAGGQDTSPQAAGGVRPTTHAVPAGPLAVPEVPFDPRSETRRLRSTR